MKALILVILLTFTAGCATLGATPGTQGNSGSAVGAADTDPVPATFTAPSQNQNVGPRIVIPVTGGVPVIGIPLGGDLYLPVTGGAPIVGIPISP